MMASNRWVAIDPDILTHPLVGAGQPVAPADPERGAYSRMEAWLWIICNASFQDHTVMNRGRKMTLRRGDLLGAWAFLAHTFNWSAKTVRSWVESLINDNMLQRRALEQQEGANEEPKNDVYYGNQATILNIVNYWRFQFESEPQNASNGAYIEGNQNGNQLGNQSGNQFEELSASKLADKYILQQQQGQPVGQPPGQPKGQHITSNNTSTVESKQLTLSEPSSDEKVLPEAPEPKRKKPRRKHAAEYSEAFEIFWGAYPDRTNNSKVRAFAEWETLEEPEQNAALASLPAFSSYCHKNPEYRTVHAERYLSQRRWESFQPQVIHGVWWQDAAQVAKVSRDRWLAGIAKHANGIWPSKELGPPPGASGCVVPRALIDELRLTERFDHNGIARKRP